jgi:hypothetical protein
LLAVAFSYFLGETIILILLEIQHPLVSRGLRQRIVWYTAVFELIPVLILPTKKCNITFKCQDFLWSDVMVMCAYVIHPCILFSDVHVITLVCFKQRHRVDS